MPIHEYKCSDCGKVYEMLQRSEEPVQKCESCDGKLEKLISSFSTGRSSSQVQIPLPSGWTFVGEQVGKCLNVEFYCGDFHRNSGLN